MAAQAQEICEKYIKHIIGTYHKPTQSQEEEDEFKKIMRTHNLMKLTRYMKNHTEFSFPADTNYLLAAINGYYFSTRYPGDESLEITKDDIELCYRAVETCRNNIFEILREAENEKDNVDNDFDIEK